MLQQLGHLSMGWLMIALLAILASSAFFMGRVRAEQVAAGSSVRAHSRPNYHGYFVAICAVAPAGMASLFLGLFGDGVMRSALARELPDAFGMLSEMELKTYLDAVAQSAARGGYSGADRIFAAVTNRYLELRGLLNTGVIVFSVLAGAVCMDLARRRVSPQFRARTRVDSILETGLFVCAAIAIATTIGIVASLLFESLKFFAQVPITEFLFGTRWNAQTSAEFGALPLFFGTFMIALIAMIIAAPVGLFAAIYLSEYAGPSVRSWVKPVLEVLAGIPTVVYGFFALLVVAPAVRSCALWLNETIINLGLASGPVLAAQPTSALAAGLVMGIMVIPFVSSLSDDVINAVPQTLRDGAFALGATKSETIREVVIPAALPGIIAALLLAVSRAVGETMIVVMAAGKGARISMDPTADLTTITVQIVSLMTGETGFDDPKTLSAFALGLVLFAVTLLFNVVALRVVQKFREKYD